MSGSGTRWLSSVGAGLVDLVFPGGCAGCGSAGGPWRFGVCPRCVAAVTALLPATTRPDPSPSGLPPCVALGEYGGVLRELVVGYKDRGRHRLAGPLGRLLAQVVASLVGAPGPVSAARARLTGRVPAAGARLVPPVVLVPVPDTAAAARARHGDHMWRLARAAAAALRGAGYPVALARPLRALPRPDSAGLDAAGRAAAAYRSLRTRPLAAARLRRRTADAAAPVVLVDDVITTGVTLAAATGRLAAAGVPVAGAAVLAATRRLHPPAGSR